MKSLVLAVAAAFLAAAPAGGPLTIEQLIDIRHPSNPIWSTDGKSVVFVWDRAGVASVYVVARRMFALLPEMADAVPLVAAHVPELAPEGA